MAEKLSSKLTWAEFITVFKTYDADGNGFIQDGELDQFLDDLQKSCGDEAKHLSKSEFKAKVMKKDAVNKDGKIELVELASILLVEEENFLQQFKKQSKDSKLSSVNFIKIWKHFDVDRSGYLDAIELEAFYLDLFATNENRKELSTKIKSMAKATLRLVGGEDKKVSIKELASFLPVEENFPSGKSTTVGDNFDETFDKYDKDKSGCIELGELEAMLKDLGLKDKETNKFHELFVQLDENKDGKIQKSELQLLFKN